MTQYEELINLLDILDIKQKHGHGTQEGWTFNKTSFEHGDPFSDGCDHNGLRLAKRRLIPVEPRKNENDNEEQ